MKGLIFTWLLTALGVSSSVISPFYGFLAYVALAILKPDSLWAHAINGGRFSLMVAMAMLISWVARGCGNWNLGRARPIAFCFVGFWLWSILGAMNADSPGPAWYFVEEFARILLPFMVGLTTIRSVRDLKMLAWVIVICESYVCFEMNMWYFSGYNYLWHIGFAGMDNNSVSIGFVAVLGLCIFLFFSVEKFWQQAMVAVCAAFIAHAIKFSFSRGAMLAAVLTAGISFFLIKKTTKHYVLFGTGLMMGLVVAGPEVRDRFMKTFEKKEGKYEASAQSRLDLWKDCYTVFMRDPIMGCGPNHWPLHAASFGWTPLKEAHSLWVQTTAEQGIPGISLLAGFYLITIWRCWLLLRSQGPDDDPWIGDLCRMTIASLIGFAVAAQFVSLETLEIPYYVTLLGAGVLMLSSREQRGQHQHGVVDFGVLNSDAPALAVNAQPAMELSAATIPYNRQTITEYSCEQPAFGQHEFESETATEYSNAFEPYRDWRDAINDVPSDMVDGTVDNSDIGNPCSGIRILN